MAGRPPLRIGQHGKITRTYLGSGGWVVATLIDDDGLSPRVGADQLGHSKVSMTQDRYMARGRVHTEVAELLDRAIKGE